MSFWVKRVQPTDFQIGDLSNATIEGGGGERDLHSAFYYDDICKSADLSTALAALELVKITGPGGSDVPVAEAYWDSVQSHRHAGSDVLLGGLVEEVSPAAGDLWLMQRAVDGTARKVKSANLPGSGGGGSLSKIFYADDSTGGMKVTTTPQAIALNEEHFKDDYFSHSETVNPSEVTILQAGWYIADARCTVGSVSDLGGIRGNPVLEMQVDLGAGWVSLSAYAGDYVRENATHMLSANMSIGPYPVQFSNGDKIRMVVYDTVATPPDEETVAQGSALFIRYEDRSGTGGTVVNNLKDVGDVNAPAPYDGSKIVFDVATSQWSQLKEPRFRGFLTKTQMEAVSSPVQGDWCVCSTFEGKHFIFDGEAWIVPGEVVRVENRSGGFRVEGDVVVLSGAFARAANITTTLEDINVLGPIVSGGPAGVGNYVTVAVAGLPWSVKISGSVGIGDGVYTDTTATQAYSSTYAGPGSFGQTLESKSLGIALVACWIKAKEIY